MNNIFNKLNLSILSACLLMLFSSSIIDNINPETEDCENSNDMRALSSIAGGTGDILGFYTPISATGSLPIVIVDFPKLNGSSTGVSLTTLSTFNFTPSTVMLPTNTSSYNSTTEELVCLVSRERQLFMYEDVFCNSSTLDLAPHFTTAPVHLGSELYGIDITDISPGGVATISIAARFDTGFPIGVGLHTFPLTSPYVFNHEQMSSATNGTDELYFISGIDLITVTDFNQLNVTITDMCLDQNNEFIFYGLEYCKPNVLIAMRKNNYLNPVASLELVEIDITTPSSPIITVLYDLQNKLSLSPAGWIVNTEFYSTTYDTCNQCYYISSRYDFLDQSRLVEINILTKTHVSQIFPLYLFGIEMKDVNCDGCKCGTYYDMSYRPNQGAPNVPVSCGETLIAQCDGMIPWTLDGYFLCNGSDCPDSTEMFWTLTKPDLTFSMGQAAANPGFGISIPASEFGTSGLYQLSLGAICGQDTCNCDFLIEVQCDPDSCCTTLDAFCDRIENAVTITIDNESCKAKITIDSLDCDNYLEYIDWGGGFENGPYYPGDMAMHVYPGSGTYIISYLAIELNEDGFICFEKIVSDTITIVCETCICPGSSSASLNLVTNGNFSSSNIVSCTDLINSLSCTFGTYWVGTNFTNKCTGWPSVGDHTGDIPAKFMIIDGNPSIDPVVWCQSVNVTPGMSYCFSYWTASVFCDDEQEFTLNAIISNNTSTEIIGQANIVETCQTGQSPTWINHSFTWKCPSSFLGPYNLELVQISGIFGNDYADFGIDDICFTKTTPPDSCCTTLEAFCDRIENAVTITIDNDSCKVKLMIDSLDCNDYLEYIDWGGSIDCGPFYPGDMAMHVYPGSGTYIISYLAIELDEDGYICFEKFVSDTITVVCTGCPCGPDDIQAFSDAVDKGFATISSSPFNCVLCLAPLGLSNCDSVEWHINGISPPPDFISQGNQTFCYNFVTSGQYQVTMVVTRYKPDGSICEIFTYSRNIFVNCNIDPSNCTAIVFPNPGFGDGAIPGGLNPGGMGMSDGWTAASGEPIVIEGASGSLDGWTIDISTDIEGIDVLTTIEPICPEDKIDTLSLRFGIKEKGIKSSISIVFYRGDDFEVPNSTTWNPIRCLRLATIDLDPLEENVWYDLNIIYDISEWIELDSCSIRPAIYAPCCSLPVTSRTSIQIDGFCGKKIVSTNDIPNNQSINLFPNPTTGELTIHFDQGSPIKSQIQILDLMGRVVQSEMVTNGHSDFKFTLDMKLSGVYFVKIIENGMPIWVEKIIKL